MLDRSRPRATVPTVFRLLTVLVFALALINPWCPCDHLGLDAPVQDVCETGCENTPDQDSPISQHVSHEIESIVVASSGSQIPAPAVLSVEDLPAWLFLPSAESQQLDPAPPRADTLTSHGVLDRDVTGVFLI